MNYKLIKTQTAYQKAIKRTLQIFDAVPKTKKGEKLSAMRSARKV